MRFSLNDKDICSEEIEGEVIIINLTTGCYYSLVGSAAALWPLALAGWSATEIAAQFMPAGSEPTSIEAEITAFIDHLRAENILLTRSDAVRQEVTGLAPATTFTTPFIEKFTDMQELLLVDPIHEVAEAGWPLRETKDP
jgi:hypothetical protein